MISIHDQAAMRASVRPHRQRLVHPHATARTVLRGELRGDCYHGHLLYPSVVVHPPEEPSPSGIADTLGKLVVLDQVSDLKVFILCGHL
jgi:hypothetical protein